MPNKPLKDADFHQYKGHEFALDEQPSIVLPDGTPYGNPKSWGKYVLRHRNAKGKVEGYTHLGYDVVISRINRYFYWIIYKSNATFDHDVHPSIVVRGSVEAFKTYVDLVDACIEAAKSMPGGKCEADLSPQLIGLEGKLVEVVDKHGETRRFVVDRSMGPMVIHLESDRRGSTGGMAASFDYKSVRVIN